MSHKEASSSFEHNVVRFIVVELPVTVGSVAKYVCIKTCVCLDRGFLEFSIPQGELSVMIKEAGDPSACSSVIRSASLLPTNLSPRSTASTAANKSVIMSALTT